MSCGQRVLWAPERMERPTTSTSSWTAAEAIISGVWRRPVVNDLHAGVAKGAGDDFGAAVVAVEAGLGD